ncbi:MAG TPA: hypothetical protein VG227_08760 [Caulobacteraceae bacterium]|jgi:hypothetical protein|nr:hypothetical protein [Caulobacteraceae bacterium]
MSVMISLQSEENKIGTLRTVVNCNLREANGFQQGRDLGVPICRVALSDGPAITGEHSGAFVMLTACRIDRRRHGEILQANAERRADLA